jgi:hypothetical protein
VNAADGTTLVLADGFSCQTQVEQMSDGRQAMHLAEILALGIRETELGRTPERLIERPGRPQHVRRRRLARVHPFGRSSR